MTEERRLKARLSAIGAAVAMALGSPPAQSQHSADDAPSSPPRRIEQLEELVVTGSRLRPLEAEGPSPVRVFDRQRIDELGIATLGELLEYLPEQPYSFSQASNSTGAQFLEVRGLGIGSTLVLINGRRVTASAADVAFNAFDMNTIPVAAIDRVEVLAESASAVYGADAMGGVVNVILRKDIPRPALDLRYGAAAGGAEEQRASLAAGYSTDRLSASLILDYFDKQPLLGAERDFYRNQDFRRFGGEDLRSPNTNPGNIRSRTGSNLPGLPSTFAAVPAGSTGLGMTPDDFLETAGERRMDSLLRYWSIVPAVRRSSAALFAEADFAPSLSGFAEALYVERRSDTQSDPAQLSGVLVPETNAFNPFGVPVSANFLFTGVGPRHRIVESELARATLGVRGALGAWSWEVSGMHSEEDARSQTINNIDVARRNAALASSDPSQALNVFQDGPGGSPELLASLVATPALNEYGAKGALASAFVRGPLASLPAGDIDVVVGAEWRGESILVDDSRFIDQDRQASAVYAELRAPLLGGAASVVAAKALTLTLAARYDDYSDFGDRVSPQVGLTWFPASTVLLRANYGKGFRAPSLFELYAPRTRIPLPIVDPRRGSEIVDAEVITGGNPDLDPITSKFTTAGVVWSPELTGNPRFSADFWRIRLDQRVAFFPDELVLAHESRYPERVIRADPTPEEIAAGLPGQILAVDISRINFGRLDTHGVDLGARWSFPTPLGRFSPSLSATRTGRYRTLDLPDTPQVDRVGVGSLDGTIPRWRAVGAVAWSKDALTASITARYTAAYDDADPFGGERNGRTIDSQVLVDVQGAIELDALLQANSGWLRRARLSVGAVNLFDEAPQFAELGVSAGHDLSQGDLRQRFVYAQLSKQF